MCERRKVNGVGNGRARIQKSGKQDHYDRRPPHKPPKENEKGNKNKPKK